MKHLDLFSGIGGFALAVEAVWPEAEHVFCEIDPFCQQVLKKHFPNSKIHEDIKTLTYTDNGRSAEQKLEAAGNKQRDRKPKFDLLTGGFPCQPFSAAGKRRAQNDDRYLWPEMLRVIRETRPTWIVGENVAGIINLALEQVCLDLEAEGYEVQPFIIPACAVNAPHRRDRVWIVAYASGERRQQESRSAPCDESSDEGRTALHDHESSSDDQVWEAIADSSSTGLEGRQQSEAARHNRFSSRKWRAEGYDWEADWPQVATELCGVDDGLPVELDGFKLTKAQHRAQRLKALGNAIVPQIAIEIFKAISLSPDPNSK